MEQFNITNRMAKAIMLDVKTSINSHKALFDYQLSKCKIKISKLSNKITKLKRKLQAKKYGKFKTKINLQKHLFKCQVKLNKLKQFLACNKHSVTFGTKKLLKSSINKFLNKRDSQISYYGDKHEYRQNQQFQISYNTKFNRFDYKLRLDNVYITDSKYIYGSFYLKDKTSKREIQNILKLKDRPLSYKIIKKDNKLYLHIMFRYNKLVTVSDNNGVLGIDFNKGFITMSDIDKNGKLLKLYKIPYIHKAKLLKFSKFKQKLINKTCKTGSDIKLVNPAYTSRIALNKYCYTMKLNVHSGASYVIARRYYSLD